MLANPSRLFLVTMPSSAFNLSTSWPKRNSPLDLADLALRPTRCTIRNAWTPEWNGWRSGSCPRRGDFRLTMSMHHPRNSFDRRRLDRSLVPLSGPFQPFTSNCARDRTYQPRRRGLKNGERVVHPPGPVGLSSVKLGPPKGAELQRTVKLFQW